MTAIPSVEKYVRALESLHVARAISDVQWRWLRAHYQAPEYTLTTMELARLAKYEAHGGVNLHYGRFGADLATRLEWPVPPDQPHASAFATFTEGDPKAPDTRWHLRPEVVAALDHLRWFPRPTRTPA